MTTINENDVSTWPGAPADVLRYIENEASDLHASAKNVAKETGMEPKQAYWAVVTLYADYYRR